MGLVNLKCPGCGQPITMDESREFGFCNYCGNKVMVDKTIIEHRGSVKIDTTENVKNWREVARRAMESNDLATAAKYYEMIVTEEPNDWEAAYYSLHFSSLNIKNKEINQMSHRIKNSIKGIIKIFFIHKTV